jgi:hypothetical protein
MPWQLLPALSIAAAAAAPAPAPSAATAARRGERQLLSSSLLGVSHPSDESAAAKGRRAQLFTAWLVELYGRETLNSGAGVLDVAGECVRKHAWSRSVWLVCGTKAML